VLDPVATPVLSALAGGPRTVDELTLVTGLGAGPVAAVLARLELEGQVVAVDGTFRSTIAR
jgi:predicted Rossmann fold nucleotide-binding protein DprA/Smf involved in DNA uptake